MAKCGLCGLTFIGTHTIRPGGRTDSYYRCNGKHGTRGIYGAQGKRCPSKDVNGAFLEDAVWNDIEGFLRNPGAVAEILRQKINKRGKGRDKDFDRRSVEIAVANKAEERARVLALFRKGRIDEAALDSQLDEIETEEMTLRARLEAAKPTLVRDDSAALATVEMLLERLRTKLDQGISWELKRELAEVLIDGITVDTIGEGKQREAVIKVRYRFSSPDKCMNSLDKSASSVDTCRDTDSLLPPA
jgi:site-specific DNA recombinase